MSVIRPQHVPQLANGDRLTRDEFEGRYRGLPRAKKAELLDGEVFMPSPVRIVAHGQPHALLVTWLTVYAGNTPDAIVGDNATIRLDNHNEPQPDGLLMISPDAGGQAQVDEDGYVDGAPELIGEVAASTVSIDLHTKFRVYQRNGVREYLVWRVDDERIDWFVFEQGKFEPLPAADDGLYKSRIFPGLWLNMTALIRQDLTAVLAALTRGVASPEHAGFVTRLAAARTQKT